MLRRGSKCHRVHVPDVSPVVSRVRSTALFRLVSGRCPRSDRQRSTPWSAQCVPTRRLHCRRHFRQTGFRTTTLRQTKDFTYIVSSKSKTALLKANLSCNTTVTFRYIVVLFKTPEAFPKNIDSCQRI